MESQKIYYTNYKITNLVNGKIYYGMHQTTDLEDGYMGSGSILKSAFDKHGIENFRKDIVELHDTREEMIAGEVRLIESIDLNCSSNYNVAPGGQGGNTRTGVPHTQATKDKIRDSRLGWIATDEAKESMRLGQLGRKHPQHVKDKMSRSHLGKKKSPEHRKNIGLGLIGNVPWNKGKKMPPEFGEAISKGKLAKRA